MLFWTSIGITFDEYQERFLSNVLLDGFVYYMISVYVFIFLSEFVKCKNRQMTKWLFGKIITYTVTFGVQLLIIYLLNTFLSILVITVIAIISFFVSNLYEFPREYTEAQKGRFSVLELKRNDEQKSFEALDSSTKMEKLRKMPSFEKMKIKAIPYFIVCAIIPCVFAVIYYFVLK